MGLSVWHVSLRGLSFTLRSGLGYQEEGWGYALRAYTADWQEAWKKKPYVIEDPLSREDDACQGADCCILSSFPLIDCVACVMRENGGLTLYLRGKVIFSVGFMPDDFAFCYICERMKGWSIEESVLRACRPQRSSCVFYAENLWMFPALDRSIGLYPIADSLELAWNYASFCSLRLIQLRIKPSPTRDLQSIEQEIQEAIRMFRTLPTILVINDYWEYALKYGAEAVHLGQEDLDTVSLEALAQSGIKLGVSTHGYYELLRALSVNPSYIALGPIFPTESKKMAFAPQGIRRISEWKRWIGSIPLVAIGGITLGNAEEVYRAGADGISMISCLKDSSSREALVTDLEMIFFQNRYSSCAGV